MPGRPSPPQPYAELHCHTNFSFLDGAAAADELVDQAVALGSVGARGDRPPGSLRGRPVHDRRPGGRPPSGRRAWSWSCWTRRCRTRTGSSCRVAGPARWATECARVRRPARSDRPDAGRVGPARPRPERTRLPGHREPGREDLRGDPPRERGPHLVLLARDRSGYRSLCRLSSAANLAGTKGVPRFSHALLARHTEGIVALTGCRHGEIARRLRAGDREGADGRRGLRPAVRRRVGAWRAAAARPLARAAGVRRSRRPGSSSSSTSPARRRLAGGGAARLAEELGCRTW